MGADTRSVEVLGGCVCADAGVHLTLGLADSTAGCLDTAGKTNTPLGSSAGSQIMEVKQFQIFFHPNPAPLENY